MTTSRRKWRVALALDVLLLQVDRKAPARSKRSDGSIASAAHSKQNPTSDHEAKIDDPDSDYWIVAARDFTHDPAGGLDCHELAAQLVATGDKRIRYIIWDGRIWYPNSGWQTYKGANMHRTHLHLSVKDSNELYDSQAAWSVFIHLGMPIPVSPVAPVTSERPTLRKGSKGDAVGVLQTRLNLSFPTYRHEHGVLKVDEDFGPTTDAWVREFQERSRLSVDGVVGPRTWKALGL